MRLFGLIGHPLTHSFSKKYFERKFLLQNLDDTHYELFDIQNLTELDSIVKNNPQLVGLNVTIPYKEEIIPILSAIDSTAKEIGAVNTVKVDGSELIGYNTDYIGFQQSIKPFLTNKHERALILGTGGASKAIKFVLEQLNIGVLYVSRNPQKDNEIGYTDINEHVLKHHQIIINCTPLGTFPDIDSSPDIPYNMLSDTHLLYDLVYNPEKTSFLEKGQAFGATIINGLQMLQIQAEKSWEIWNS